MLVYSSQQYCHLEAGHEIVIMVLKAFRRSSVGEV
jgi:hypothetical protein